MQGWDESHAAASAVGRQGPELAAACLREVCGRVASLGERFYPNDVRPPACRAPCSSSHEQFSTMFP